MCVVGSKKKKTKIIRDTLNPQWTVGDPEIFKLYVCIFCAVAPLLTYYSKIRKGIDAIILECYDWDRFNTDDRMGMVCLSLLVYTE